MAGKDKSKSVEEIRQIPKEEKLALLEERHEKGEISDETYQEIKASLEQEPDVPVQPEPDEAIGEKKKISLGKGRAISKPVLIGITVGIAIVVIVASMFALGIFKKEKETGDGLILNLEDLEETGGETITWVDPPIILEGDIAGGGPSEVIPDELVPFMVNDTVSKIDITMTWDPQSHDLDLEVLDPNGNVAGSSGNAPGEPETVSITKRIKPGEWNAKIDPFFTVNVHYTLEIIFTHEVEIGAGGGDGSGLLHMQQEIVEGKTDETDSTFHPEQDVETLYIQLDVLSDAGRMYFEITNPDGDVVFKKEIEGAEQVSESGEVLSKPGEWTVHYEWDGWTGQYVAQVIANTEG